MPLTFAYKSQTSVPVDVRNLRPEKLGRLTPAEISKLPIGLGNVSEPVSTCFAISGEPSEHIVFDGDLCNVHHIGHGMSDGFVEVMGNAGRHVGDSMCGGKLVVVGDVSDFAGYEMRGGTLVVRGNAGDQLGGCYPGAKYGMNRGSILVAGNAGEGVGHRMRRGTIVVVGDADSHLGWQMQAGTIAVLGRASDPIGVDMKRGTILLFAALQRAESELGASYTKGFTGSLPVFSMLKNHIAGLLDRFDIKYDAALLATDSPIEMWHGDKLAGGRGEVFFHVTN